MSEPNETDSKSSVGQGEYNRTIDRVYQEIDGNAERIEKLSEVVYQNAATLGIVSKLTIFVVLSVIGGAIAFGWNLYTDKVKEKPVAEEALGKEVKELKELIESYHVHDHEKDPKNGHSHGRGGHTNAP